jgi:hypothetical protein
MHCLVHDGKYLRLLGSRKPREIFSHANKSSFKVFDIAFKDRLTTTLYGKHNEFTFVTVKLRILCSNIPLSPAYGVYISQLILYARACL